MMFVKNNIVHNQRGICLNKKTKKDSVHRTLKREIASGFLLPGTRLIELELASRFGVSRTVVREVIKHLALEGLVDLEPYKGAKVTMISLKDLEDIYRVQQDLEGLASYLAVTHITDKEIDELERIHEGSKEHVKGDALEWQRWNNKFHRLFLENCGNRRLVELVQSHRDQFARYYFLVTSIPGNRENYMKEHEAIIEAVKAKDPVQVRFLMEKHIGDGVKELLEITRNIYPSSYTP